MSLAAEFVFQRIETVRRELQRPVVVALDGGSGAGKSTIAERLTRMSQTALVSMDDFYQTCPNRSGRAKR